MSIENIGRIVSDIKKYKKIIEYCEKCEEYYKGESGEKPQMLVLVRSFQISNPRPQEFVKEISLCENQRRIKYYKKFVGNLKKELIEELRLYLREIYD